MAVVPYKDQTEGKKAQVAQMFNNISKKYDFLNRLLSMGIDIYWRKQAVKVLKKLKPELVLDIATGTGDFAIEALKANPKKVIGVDISEGMLEIGKEKIKKLGLEDRIEMQMGDSEKLLFEDNKFDAVIVAFGVRNFENLPKGLADMNRVLKPGGQLIVLEISQPESFPLKQIYNFYFTQVLPRIGKLISKDTSAYTYLPESVKAFPNGEKFLKELRNVGYKETRCKKLTFGICSMYVGTK